MGLSERLGRTRLAAGDEMMERLGVCRVIIFGVGGVGSWAAESLVRSGVGHLTIVDSDLVAESNINRQLMATTSTVGRPKVEVLAERLRDINPDIDLTALQKIYDSTTADSFDLGSYDYVIDAIDSLECKALLITRALECRQTTLFSSMGAALKLTVTDIAVADFAKVEGCPLARALRRKFRASGGMPRRKFLCVYSPERLSNRASAPADAPAEQGDTWSARKAAINGTFAPAVAAFGLTLASLILKDIYAKTS